MTMTIIFANSPFDKEIRYDCQKVKMNTEKYGEICILPNYRDTIFDINTSIVSVVEPDGKVINIQIVGSTIVKIKNNIINIFGQFSEIKQNNIA